MSRGRGRGPQLTFNVESLGIGKSGNDAPGILIPPSKFPARLNKAIPLKTGAEQSYLVHVRKELVQHMRSSAFYLKERRGKESGKVADSSIERYSDRYENHPDLPLELNWSYFPAELNPANRNCKKKSKQKRHFRPNVTSAAAKRSKVSLLEDLEKKEAAAAGTEAEQEAKKGESDEDDDDEAEEGKDEEGDDEDEELDEGTDYVNNFIDSDVDDEDDNLDEGGIY